MCGILKWILRCRKLGLILALGAVGSARAQTSDQPLPSIITTSTCADGEANTQLTTGDVTVPDPDGHTPQIGGLTDWGDRSGLGGIEGFGGHFMNSTMPTASYRAMWFPSVRVTNEDGRHLGFVEQSLSASAPI